MACTRKDDDGDITSKDDFKFIIRFLLIYKILI